MRLWIVRFATRIPSFCSSPRSRSAPQVGFSRAIRMISAPVSSEILGRGFSRRRVLRAQSSLKPSLCQRRTVSGFASKIASRHVEVKALGENEYDAVGRLELGLLGAAREQDDLLSKRGILGA
jgi:hypothetical protein